MALTDIETDNLISHIEKEVASANYHLAIIDKKREETWVEDGYPDEDLEYSFQYQDGYTDGMNRLRREIEKLLGVTIKSITPEHNPDGEDY